MIASGRISINRRSRGIEDNLPSEVINELAAAVGRDHATKLSERMAAGVRAYERDRYTEGAYAVVANTTEPTDGLRPSDDLAVSNAEHAPLGERTDFDD